MLLILTGAQTRFYDSVTDWNDAILGLGRHGVPFSAYYYDIENRQYRRSSLSP